MNSFPPFLFPRLCAVHLPNAIYNVGVIREKKARESALLGVLSSLALREGQRAPFVHFKKVGNNLHHVSKPQILPQCRIFLYENRHPSKLICDMET